MVDWFQEWGVLFPWFQQKNILAETPIGPPLPSQELSIVSSGRVGPMPWIYCAPSLVKNESVTLWTLPLLSDASLWITLLLILNLVVAFRHSVTLWPLCWPAKVRRVLKVCVSQKVLGWSSKPQCDDIWRWGLWEVIRVRWYHEGGASWWD